jgi:uncharacterized protein
MKIRVCEIPPEGLSLVFEPKPEYFPVLAEMAAQGAWQPLGPIRVQLDLTPAARLFRANGRLEVAAKLTCARCLREFTTTLSARFDLFYQAETLDAGAGMAEGDVELSQEALRLIPYRGEEIDFTEMIQEQVTLAVPFKPLCADNCRGLCPQCGTDLNQGSCGCSKDAEGSPFAALGLLRQKTDSKSGKP